MTGTAFFNGVSPALWYSHILYNQLFGTSFKPTDGLSGTASLRTSRGGASSNQLEALNGLYARQYDVLALAEELSTANSSSVFYQQAAASSDESVAEIGYFDGNNYSGEVPDAAFEFNVTQIAEETIYRSDALDPTASSAIGSGVNEFDLQIGSGPVYNLSFDNTAAFNREALELMAESVNEANTDVTASVVEGANGFIYLEVASGLTGSDNGFTLTQSGSGTPLDDINLVETQAAANAQYSIDGTSYDQSNNAVLLYNGNLRVDLTGAGAAAVTIEPDTEAITDTFNDLVSSMNDLTGYLASNQYLTGSLSREWSRLLYGAAFDLGGYGLSMGSNKSLSLDTSVFTSALNDNLIGVREAVGGMGGLVSDILSFGHRISSSPGASLLSSPPNSGYGSLYLRSISSSPFFRQGSSTFWQTV